MMEALLLQSNEDDLLDVVQKLAMTKDPLSVKDSVALFMHTYMGKAGTTGIELNKKKTFLDLLDKLPVLVREAERVRAASESEGGKRKKKGNRRSKGADDGEDFMWD